MRLQHRLEKKKCQCGAMFSAPAPVRVTEGGLHGPGLHAYAVVSKCADALPLYRISKRFARAGVNIARSSPMRGAWGFVTLRPQRGLTLKPSSGLRRNTKEHPRQSLSSSTKLEFRFRRLPQTEAEQQRQDR